MTARNEARDEWKAHLCGGVPAEFWCNYCARALPRDAFAENLWHVDYSGKDCNRRCNYCIQDNVPKARCDTLGQKPEDVFASSGVADTKENFNKFIESRASQNKVSEFWYAELQHDRSFVEMVSVWELNERLAAI